MTMPCVYIPFVNFLCMPSISNDKIYQKPAINKILLYIFTVLKNMAGLLILLAELAPFWLGQKRNEDKTSEGERKQRGEIDKKSN